MHLFCSGAPPHIGCSAPYRVQCPRACGGCGGCRGCGGLLCLSCLPLGVSSAWGSSVCWAWVVFCLGCLLLGSLWRLMLWFLRNVARNSPTCISNVEITSLEFCGFLDTYEKLGYPNYVRVLVDEAPEANSCVRSSHDTVHDPRDTSLRAPVAANAHMHDRGTPPAGLMRQAPDHRVTRLALAPAASTPPVLTSKKARQHCMVRLNALTRHLQPQAIQARERAPIRAIKGSAGHVEVFQMDGVGTPIIGRPRPLSGHDTPNPAHNTYTLTCEEPVYCPDEPGVLTPRPHGARSAWRRAWPARAPRSSRRA